jgi:surface antigen
MRVFGTGVKAWLLGSAILFSCPLLVDNAEAAQHERHSHPTVKPTISYRARSIGTHATLAYGAGVSHAMYAAGKRDVSRSYGISCVPYARQASGIMVAGNAWQWWENAAGLYARGDRPEVGSVLNFRANGRMRLGHVAVVTQVVNSREVIVDHANWPSFGGRGGVSHDVSVVDVSEANNWSAVRVELGRDGTFGSVYPTYGFIYNRPDTGAVIASVAPPAPQAEINPVPSDLRPKAERPWHTVEEVAEAPATSRGINLSVTTAPIGR